MVSLPISQSFSTSFSLFHFRCFLGQNTSQEVDNSKLLRIQLAIFFEDKYSSSYSIITTYQSVFYDVKPYRYILHHMGPIHNFIWSNMVFKKL